MRTGTFLTLATLLLAAGCGTRESETAANAAPANEAGNVVNVTDGEPEEEGAPAGNTEVSAGSGDISFRYSWPKEATAIAELDGWLRGNAERLKTETLNKGAANEKDAKANDYPFVGYSYSEDWTTVANVPALLILQSDGYSFTGGAHGMPVVTALFWDKAAKKRLATGAIFDMPKLAAAMKDRFCKALDAERAKKRGGPANPDQLSQFDECVDVTKQTILPVSLKGGALDAVRVVIMPYEAGPYAEGIYELDFPIDAALRGAVKPAYQGAFGAS